MTIEIKSFRDMDGNTVSIGDQVRYVTTREDYDQVRTVRRITKSGYFISVYVEDITHAWYMPKICVRKVRKASTSPTQTL